MKRSWNVIFFLPFLIAGCLGGDDNSSTGGTDNGHTIKIDSIYTSGTAEGSFETGFNANDLVENLTFTSKVSIAFGAGVTITNPLAGAGVEITQSGADVVITSTASEVEYVLSGSTTNGSLKVYSTSNFKLTLSGVSIANADGPAINIQSLKKTFVVIGDNTSNTLSDGSPYASSTEDMKGTLFSEGPMIFSGNGTLSLSGSYKHALVSDDYIRVRKSTITITGTLGDGIHVSKAFIADGGKFSINSKNEGIESESGQLIINSGAFELTTTGAGLKTSYAGADQNISPDITILDADSLVINATEGVGIESKGKLTINGGIVSVKTVEDGLTAGKAIYINGGLVYSYSTKNDAIDSDGTFTLTGGKVVAIGAASPEAGIDCGTRAFKVTGGILVGLGGDTSGPDASISTVPSLVMGSGYPGQITHIESADGVQAVTFLNPVGFTTMLVAGSRFKSNTTYTLYSGGSVSKTATDFHGLYTSGEYTTGTALITFTITNLVTQLGGSISK